MNNHENRGVKKDSVYEEFILWTSMPPSERHKLGIETQQQFSECYGISINTPTAWKRRPDFQQRVSGLRKEWAFEKTSIVLESILRSAMQGKPASQKLWLQYFHNFPKEQEREAENKQAVIHHNDIRSMLEVMPPQYKEEGYNHLLEIMRIISEVGSRKLIPDDTMVERGDHDVSPLDEGEFESVSEEVLEAKKELHAFDLDLKARGLDDIMRRGI